ncbi:hypothetical protein COLO4_02442 [Corchorus olitorius]|uniref:Uncharacterized protein n=1 Tax=Corchorus olitorius TaxID=93759 RepID=A0A1R3L154_9ROSI|nr:hypothetical protein COLO4_02442 [Corchorus olitorius]
MVAMVAGTRGYRIRGGYVLPTAPRGCSPGRWCGVARRWCARGPAARRACRSDGQPAGRRHGRRRGRHSLPWPAPWPGRRGWPPAPVPDRTGRLRRSAGPAGRAVLPIPPGPSLYRRRSSRRRRPPGASGRPPGRPACRPGSNPPHPGRRRSPRDDCADGRGRRRCPPRPVPRRRPGSGRGLLEILGGVAQFDARRLAPVEVRHQHAVALLGQLVGHGAHGGVDAEDLLAQDDARTATVDGGHEVGVEGAGRRRYVDIGSGHRKRLQVAQVWNHLRRGARCGAVRRLPRPSPWRS